MKKYEFSNHDYINAHGVAPRGTGHWAFVVKNVTLENISAEVYIERISSYRKDTIFWVPGFWTLTEAKKRAAVMLEANAVPFGTEIEVAP